MEDRDLLKPLQKGKKERNYRTLGTEKEKIARAYLEKQGVVIVERNYRCHIGEIDLIGKHEGYLVFVEVKYRENTLKGGALAAVDLRKQNKICRVADYYRMSHKSSPSTGIRYDVVGIQGDQIFWIKNAFPHRFARRF